MKLKTVTISEFKSIQASQPFAVADITCLVGKNEAGKTALLQALYRLNPVVPSDATFDVTDDYPRNDVEDYRIDIENRTRKCATVVEAVFALEESDLADLHARFGEGVIPERSLTLSRGYSNELENRLELNEAAAVKALVAKAQLPEPDAHEASSRANLKDLFAYLSKKAESKKTAHAQAVANAEAIADAQEKATAMDEASALAETEGAKQLETLLTEILKDDFSTYLYVTYLKDRVPKFLYFDEYYQMKGAVNLEKLKERQENPATLERSDRPMLGLIDLARLNIDQLIAPTRTEELISKLQGASNHLSKTILKYWSQNKHITLVFDARQALPNDPAGMREGHNLWGMVHDAVHNVSVGLGARSRGFVWFFSFLAWYSQEKKQTDYLILLLDEPGLSLHASAQGDFLKYMEAELKPNHQVIYTTHSPFLVDPKRFDRVRIVEDKSMEVEEALPRERQGTKVSTDVLEVSKGTLFPLQGALGYEIAQTLFIGPNSLIVEGPSDMLYIHAMSSILERKGRLGLNQAWVITPVGGAGKLSTFASLIGAQSGLNVATLIDMQKAHEQSIENLYKLKLLQRSHVRTFAEFTETAEADIEDMFERDFYLVLVNSEYVKALSRPIELRALGTFGCRIVPAVENAFKAHAARGGQFNHYRPARYLTENLAELEAQIGEAALNRFERAFETLNGLL